MGLMTALLIFHLFVTIALVGLILLQRSEGGGLGIGGGGGGGGFMTTRGTANALSRMTVILAGTFFATSIGLSIMAGAQRSTTAGSVTDGLEAVNPDDPFGTLAIPEEGAPPVPAPTDDTADDGLPEVPVGE